MSLYYSCFFQSEILKCSIFETIIFFLLDKAIAELIIAKLFAFIPL